MFQFLAINCVAALLHKALSHHVGQKSCLDEGRVPIRRAFQALVQSSHSWQPVSVGCCLFGGRRHGCCARCIHATGCGTCQHTLCTMLQGCGIEGSTLNPACMQRSGQSQAPLGQCGEATAFHRVWPPAYSASRETTGDFVVCSHNSIVGLCDGSSLTVMPKQALTA